MSHSRRRRKVMSPPTSSDDLNASEDQVSRQQEEADKKRQEALSKEYGEVCNNFRTLTDIRFKLLAFLPIAAAAAVAALTGPATQQRPTEMVLALSLFGLVVTIALVTYNARNDQLYDDLVTRAADIERSLNIPDGTFANRSTTWLRIPLLPLLLEWKIDHRTAVSTIYGASIALWLFGVIRSGLYLYYGQNAPWWTNRIAIAIAIVLTVLGSLWVWYFKKRARKRIGNCARVAMQKAVELRKSQAADGDIVAFVKACMGNNSFIKVCSKLSGYEEDNLERRARFYSCLAAKNDRERLSHYLPQGPGDLEASQLIGLLTDLPPQTIYDAYHNRKGELPDSEHSDSQCR
jgi:hypothetical protein